MNKKIIELITKLAEKELYEDGKKSLSFIDGMDWDTWDCYRIGRDAGRSIFARELLEIIEKDKYSE